MSRRLCCDAPAAVGLPFARPFPAAGYKKADKTYFFDIPIGLLEKIVYCHFGKLISDQRYWFSDVLNSFIPLPSSQDNSFPVCFRWGNVSLIIHDQTDFQSMWLPQSPEPGFRNSDRTLMVLKNRRACNRHWRTGNKARGWTEIQFIQLIAQSVFPELGQTSIWILLAW